MTIQFLTSWNGHEFGSIASLGGAEAGLITAGLARAWTPGIDPTSDRAATLRYDAAGTLIGVVAHNAAGAEIVVPIEAAAALPTPPASGKVLTSTDDVAGAFAWQDPTGGVGGGSLTSTGYATAIPLDLEAGREMGLHSITTNTVLTEAGGGILNGNCNLTVVLDGSATFDISAFDQHGDTIVNAAGNTYDLSFVKRPTKSLVFIAFAGVYDNTAPQPQAAHVDNATPLVLRLPFNENIVSNGIANGDVTVTGHTVGSLAISGAELQITLTSQFVNGEAARTVSIAANKLKDAAGNLCVAIVGAAITNNVAAAAAPSSIAVANSTPTHVDFVWPVAMDQTSNPATSTLAISGHTVSAHTWVDSTHSYATVDSFSASESRTATYTKPGSGAVFKTLGGNPVATFGPTAIVDNVAGTGLFDETWPGALGDAIPGTWTTHGGLPLQHGSGQMGFTAASGEIVRNAGATDMVLTLVINPDDHFPGILFRSNSAGTNAEHLVFNESIHALRFYEDVGGTDTNIVDGVSTVVDDGSIAYTVRLTISGTALTVDLKAPGVNFGSGVGAYHTEISATMAQNLAGTYVGLSSAGISSGGVFGEFKAV